MWRLWRAPRKQEGRKQQVGATARVGLGSVGERENRWQQGRVPLQDTVVERREVACGGKRRRKVVLWRPIEEVEKREREFEGLWEGEQANCE